MNNLNGLSVKKANEILLKSGPNQIYQPEKVSFFKIAGHELTEPMILLLLTVGFFYSFWGKLSDAITIFSVIILLVFAEVYNQFRAEKAIAALGRLAAPKAKVKRNGEIILIDSEKVVPGDLLVLTVGTNIAADAKLLDAPDLQINESVLTGESFAIDKNKGDEIKAGTIVVSGEGLAEVYATGKNTRIGQIASLAKIVKAPKTPLQLAMKSLSGKLIYAAIFFSVLIPIIGFWRGQELKEMILIGLSLSFAMIPEELPLVITMILGLGAYTLSKKNFLVKKIKAAETLGNITVVVTDKTGTITENKMEIVSFFPPDAAKEIIKNAFLSLSEYAISPLDLEIIREAGEQKKKSELTIIRQRSFGSGRKTKSLIRKTSAGFELFMSGAPEEVFSYCSEISNEIKTGLEAETEKGRRVIAIASKKFSGDPGTDWPAIEKNLELSGLIGFEDPPRAGVKETISRAAAAGIRTIMVTGDHPLTAKSIAMETGITTIKQKVVVGSDIDSMSDKKLQQIVKNTSVFARTTPEHKFRIVQALQRNSEVVAVTGDGINDALALKGADIGIAMGIRGTDVAREAAEVVLADDNYITIAQGIFEGRKFFDNLQKAINYCLSVKVALILIFLLPALLGIVLPFAPIQIIILEILSDLAESWGFVFEPREKNIYSRPPRNPKEEIFNWREAADIFLYGVFLFAAVIGTYLYALRQDWPVSEAQTMAFSAWVFAHITLAFVSRSKKEPIWSIGIFSNKIISSWAIISFAVLTLIIYTPIFDQFIDMQPISPLRLLFTAAAVVPFIGLLEIKKLFNFAKK